MQAKQLIISLLWCVALINMARLPLNGAEQLKTIDLRPYWDDKRVLENPHKGWYHHFPDNHVNKYRIASDAELLDFPGMDHLYMRLAWAYLEPQEGQYNWDIIDREIKKWTKLGLGIAFRISCRETSADRIEQQYATPKWVAKAGAKGGYFLEGAAAYPDGPWEPVFDDPVFMEKLENFLAAFAARYDGKPWLRYIDIGSIGDWGEGHTTFGSRSYYGYDTRRKHLDLHLQYFQQTQLVATDAYVNKIRNPKLRKKLHKYLLEKGVTYRDDSILVDWYVIQNSDTYSVQTPELFADAYLTRPTILELEHYSHVKANGNWQPRVGSSLGINGKGKVGADYFRGAIDLLRATYIGYHGDAREWLADNPLLTGELLNRCGYWYFLHDIETPRELIAGERSSMTMTWENRGVAPAYRPYVLQIRLVNNEHKTIWQITSTDNRQWLPKHVSRQKVGITVPASLPSGTYQLQVRLWSEELQQPVEIALADELKTDDGSYQLSEILVTRTQ